jgi:hypothetical protein
MGPVQKNQTTSGWAMSLVLMIKPWLARATVAELNRWAPGFPRNLVMPRARTLLSDFKDFIN